MILIFWGNWFDFSKGWLKVIRAIFTINILKAFCNAVKILQMSGQRGGALAPGYFQEAFAIPNNGFVRITLTATLSCRWSCTYCGRDWILGLDSPAFSGRDWSL